MNDEFVDFYEILELPIEAERAEVRKRISELYLEAQKNLDHRNFDTRVRHQQLFEMTLPQARYILLDAGRREDYDRLVRVSRAPAGYAPGAASKGTKGTDTTNLAQNSGGFKISPSGIAGETPAIDALPDEAPDPETVAREREELWNKWKQGLQSAMERETARENKTSDNATTPLANRIEAANSGAPQPQTTTPVAANDAAQSKAKIERPKVKFEFGGEDSASAAESAEPSARNIANQLTPQQMQERRDNHRREIMRAELENTGIKGLAIGAATVLIPGVVAMVVFMSIYYPANQVSVLPIKNASIAWILWVFVLVGLSYACGHFLSKSMRRKQAMELSLMSYENLLRYTHKES